MTEKRKPEKPLDSMCFIAVLQQRVWDAGSQKNLALDKAISPGYLSDVLCGRREISAQLAMKFGYRKVVHFEEIPTSESR